MAKILALVYEGEPHLNDINVFESEADILEWLDENVSSDPDELENWFVFELIPYGKIKATVETRVEKFSVKKKTS